VNVDKGYNSTEEYYMDITGKQRMFLEIRRKMRGRKKDFDY
jgi:hypothetical protein